MLRRLLSALVIALTCTGRPAAAQENVTVRTELSTTVVTPGDNFEIAVIFDQAPGWHVHTNDPAVPSAWTAQGFTAQPTVITVESVRGLKFGPIQWPEPHEITVDLVGSGKPLPYKVFDGQAIAFIPVIVEPSITVGMVQVKVTVSYQACDDKVCLIPANAEFPVRFRATAKALSGPKPRNAADQYFKAFDQSVFDKADKFGPVPPVVVKPVVVTPEQIAASKAREAQKVDFDFFGVSFRVDTGSPVGLVLLVLTAVLGGLILNLTPCVLPVIPLKILGLAQAAENPRRCMILGTFLGLGVVAFWLAMGAAIAFSTGFKATSQLSSIPWFNLGVGTFMAIMATGMLGAFTVSLPQWVYRINPKHDSLHGSFMFGIMTAVLSTPCTAPFAGAATAWGATQKPPITLAVFAAIGAGMALPYLVLSAKPSLVERMPRSGPAGDLVKQVLGLLMFAVAAFFLANGAITLVAEKPYMARVLYWWLIAALVLATSFWMVVRTFQIAERPGKKVVVSLLALVLSVPAFWWANSRTQEARLETLWTEYTPALFDDAVKSGKVVVLDFTAEWCLNCKVLEAAVLNKPEVRRAVSAEGVVALRADLTGRKADGWPKLKDLGEVAIPLLAIFTPGDDKPWKSNGYTISQVVDQIDLAKSKSAKAVKAASATVPDVVAPPELNKRDPAPSGPASAGPGR